MNWLDKIIGSATELGGKYLDSKKPNAPAQTQAKTESTTPAWLMPVVIGAAALLVVVLFIKR